jgi:UDP-3-O-[3-hydroxymyristoyl] N-acetylglucosamine deacetylase/3-hydroxyacyl-[acyl-carrier-protein] dehydratase
MPGVLIIEAMGQVGGILVLKSIKNDLKNSVLYFVGLENFKFRRKVIPGDVLIMKMEFIVPIKRGLAKMKGEVYVGEELVCEGVLTAIVGKK